MKSDCYIIINIIITRLTHIFWYVPQRPTYIHPLMSKMRLVIENWWESTNYVCNGLRTYPR